MLKMFLIFYWLPLFAYGADVSTKPKKMSQFLESHALDLTLSDPVIKPNKPSPTKLSTLDLDQAPLAALDFDENLTDKILSFNLLILGTTAYKNHQYNFALKFFEEADQKGSIEAAYFSGFMQLLGLGVKPDPKIGIEKLTAAMKNGCKPAAFDLGLYLLFKDTHTQNFERALDCFQRYPHDPEFNFYYALIMRSQNELWFQKTVSQCAINGSPTAKNYLKSSKNNPIDLYRPQFYRHIHAQNLNSYKKFFDSLKAYQSGQLEQSFAFCEIAAKQKCESAEYSYLLGHLYLTAKNDPKEGLACLYHAKSRGYKPAAFDLGLRYLSGNGLVKDIQLAEILFSSHQDIKFHYHLGLALNQSDKPMEKARGLGFIKQAAVDGYELATSALKNAFTIGTDEWGVFLSEKVATSGD